MKVVEVAVLVDDEGRTCAALLKKEWGVWLVLDDSYDTIDAAIRAASFVLRGHDGAVDTTYDVLHITPAIASKIGFPCTAPHTLDTLPLGSTIPKAMRREGARAPM